jgi:Raf kinase inhibitor-like YbhB/YbcL family protein
MRYGCRPLAWAIAFQGNAYGNPLHCSTWRETVMMPGRAIRYRNLAVRRFGLLIIAVAVLTTSCNGAADERAVEMKLRVSELAAGKDIPARFTCDGEDVSPAVEWSDPPAGTRSLALIVDDPDAPGGVFTHWGAFDIEPGVGKLVEGAGNAGNAPFRQTRNDFGTQGYRGPCPPRGHGVHRYRFKLYALDVPHLGAGHAPTVADLEHAIAGHVLSVANVMAPYQRN